MKKTTIYWIVAIVAILGVGYYFYSGMEAEGQSITRTTDVIFTGTGISTLEFVPNEDMGDLSCTVSVIGSGDDTVIQIIWLADVQFPPPASTWPDEYLGYIYVPLIEGFGEWDEHVGVTLGSDGSLSFPTDGEVHVMKTQLDWHKANVHITSWFDGEIIDTGFTGTPMDTVDYWLVDLIQYMYDSDPDYYDYLLPYLADDYYLGWGRWLDGTAQSYSELGYYEDDITWTPEWVTQPITITKDGNTFTLS